MIISYLERWDLYYHAHGADFQPPGWDITIQEMVWRLKDEKPTSAGRTNPEGARAANRRARSQRTLKRKP
jgi:hypothetical protein